MNIISKTVIFKCNPWKRHLGRFTSSSSGGEVFEDSNKRQERS